MRASGISTPVVAGNPNPAVENGTFVGGNCRGSFVGRAGSLQQDLRQELPQHVAWPPKCPRARGACGSGERIGGPSRRSLDALRRVAGWNGAVVSQSVAWSGGGGMGVEAEAA